MEDIVEKYKDTQLTDRRSNFGITWSPYEQEKDFPYIVKLRLRGSTFDEIAEILNNERGYFVTPRKVQYLYVSKMKTIEVSKAADDAVEEAREMILEEIMWLKSECLKQWQAAKELNYVEEVSQSKKVGQADTDDAEELGQSSKAFSKKRTGQIEPYHSKWLELYKDLLKMEGTYRGLDNAIGGEDAMLILKMKTIVLDGGGKSSRPPITSEEELLEFVDLDEFSSPLFFRDEEE
jgi:hypothetical protein